MMLDDRLVVISTMNPWSIEPTHPVVDAMDGTTNTGRGGPAA